MIIIPLFGKAANYFWFFGFHQSDFIKAHCKPNLRHPYIPGVLTETSLQRRTEPMKNMLYIATIFVALLCRLSTAQIWLVNDVHNLTYDQSQRFANIGNNSGILVGSAESFVKPIKIDDWNDPSLCYILYPTEPIDTLPPDKQKSDSLTKKEPSPAQTINPADTSTSRCLHLIKKIGTIIYSKPGMFLVKTAKPIESQEILDCYNLYQLFKPSPQ